MVTDSNPYLLLRADTYAPTSTALAERLRQEILSRRPSPGSYLFAVGDLVRDTGYGPSVVREALRHLIGNGLIEIRRGPRGGVYARSVGSENLARSLSDMVMVNAIPREAVIEARLEIEGICARLAATRASVLDIARLEESVDRIKGLTEDSVGFANENIAFHLSVAQATGNEVVRTLSESLSEVFYDETTVFRYAPEVLLQAVEAHERLVDAIRRRDAEEAVHLMRGHIGAFNRYILDTKQLKPKGRKRP